MQKHFIAVILYFLFCQINAQNYQLNLLSGSYELEENTKDLSTKTYDLLEEYHGKRYGIIQFSITPNKLERKQLLSQGVNLLAYLPDRCYYVSFENELSYLKLKNTLLNVLGVYPILSEYKLHPKLAKRKYPAYIREGLKLLVVASVFEGVSVPDFAQQLSRDGYHIKHKSVLHNRITLKVSRAQLLNLRNYPCVFAIEPINPPSFPENHTGGTLVSSNYLNSANSSGLKYDGTGVNVMMQDDGIIGEHIDYQGRLDQTNVTSNNGDHGDHVSGTIMGAGNLDPLAQGMAPGAFLYVFGSNNNNYNSVPALYQNNDLVITSKSYSNGCNAGYTTLSRDLDEQVDLYPSLIHVFSAGNNGTSDCGYGAGSGWGNVTGGHKIGKNVICVGNLTDEDVLANSSSRGPAEDGRIKPDVCAKGTSVYSTIDVNSYGLKTGTSMSCPAVSGSITQLYHAYKELNGGQNPNSALIKAAVMNTAEDIGNPGPDFKHGWGRVNLRRAYLTLLNQQYFYDSLDNQASTSFTLNVPSGKKQLRVMVYWADFQGTAGASIALVNDLNMQIVTPSNTTFDPWILNSSPNATSLNSNAVRGTDHLNNMEQITIDNPVPGNYLINLLGFNIPSGPQDFYVVYEYRDNDVVVSYPNGGDPFVPGETEKIRWDAHGNSGNFQVEYSLNNGASWNTISNNVNSSLRYVDWTVPSTLVTGQALIRVSRGTSSDVSDAGFSIIGVPSNISSSVSCNGLELSWNSVSSATDYTVFILGNKYMDSVGSTNTTQYTLSGLLPNTNYWVSVNAVGNNGAVGRRAIAVEVQTGNSTTGTIASFTSSPSSTCDSVLSITFTNTSLSGNAYLWDFGDGTTSTQVNPSHTYTNPGLYNITLISDGGSCGIDTLIENNYIAVGQLSQPQINDVSICSAQSVLLTASSAYSIEWFDQPLGGSLIGSGPTYITPIVANSETYYVQANSIGGTSYVGPVDNSFGSGDYFTSGGRYLVFDAYTDFVLKSVWVDADGQGNRTVELRDAGGNVLQSATINIPNGQSRIDLNFSVVSGADYQLGVSASSTPNLYRNNSGVNYPYTIPNLLSIKESNAGNPLNYYYFFYDWEVETPSCSSARKPVIVSLAQPPTSSSNISSCLPSTFVLSANGTGNGTLNWYDSSSGGNYLGSGNSYTTPLVSSSQIFYVEDSIPAPSVYGAPVDNSIGAGANYNGDHHLIFDCLSASILKSVKVYSSIATNRTIQLRDNNGSVVDSKTIYIPIGEFRIDLNFSIPVGTDYELGTVAGMDQNLFRNSTGANYPYNINGLLEITTSSAGLLGYPDYYYFFYDWEVSDMPCITTRTPIQVDIDTSANVSIQSVSSVCLTSQPFNLTSSIAGGVWSGNGIVDINIGSFDPSVAGVGSHQITYLILSGNCTFSDTITIIVESSTNASINPVTPLCNSAQPFNLSASLSGGIWTGSGVLDSILGTFDPSSLNPGVYTITYTINSGCGANDQVDITILNNPNINAGLDQNICEGDTVVLSASGGSSYQWDNGVIDGQAFVPAATTSYMVTGTDSLGCTNVDYVSITVSLNTSHNVNASGIDSVIVNGQVYTQNGTYTQTLSNAAGCDSIITVSVSLDFSGFSEFQSYNIHVYPNPTRGSITITGLEGLKAITEMQIIDNMGRLIRALNPIETEIDLSKITPGVYYLQISYSDGTGQIKLVKN